VSGRRYERIVLKLSGEVLGGSSGSVLDVDFVNGLLDQLVEIRNLGTQAGIVIGGGNILRGCEAVQLGLGRVSADYIGMLGTVMNGIAIRDIAAGRNLDVRVMSSLGGSGFAEPYVVEEAIAQLQNGRIVVFVGGTGNPFLTTDTAAALRAAEIGADVLLKGTKVDGVYSADPVHDPAAKRFERITFQDAMRMELGFMDTSALWICSQSDIPIVVFNIGDERGLLKAALGEDIGTVVEGVSHD
jgi:uridylate kinase